MRPVFFIILLLICVGTLRAQDAADIIRQSSETYAGLKSYMDSGKVVSSFYNNSHPTSKAMLFKTAYADDGSFNFEYYNLGSVDINVVNRSADKKVKVWQGFTNRLISGQPFPLAIAGFVGISSLTAALVPNLLMPEEKLVPRTIFENIPNPKQVTAEVLNGVKCHKISGNDGSTSWTLWLSVDDLLIRKAENDRPVKDFRVRTVYHYFPYTTKDPSVFAFRPARKVEL